MTPRGPYRPHTRRVPSQSPAPVDSRTLDILAAVADHRFLTTELLLLLFPPDAARTPTKAITAALTKRAAARGVPPEFSGAYVGSNLKKRVRALFHDGRLDRIPRGPGTPFAYALAGPGRALLRKAGRLASRREVIGPADHLFYVEHTLMIARFRIALALAVRTHPSLTLVDSQRENRALRHAWREGGQRFSINPDGFFVLADRTAPEGRNARAAFLECDRGTISDLSRMLVRYETYARLEESGQLQDVFGISAARIVTVAATRERASDLLTLVAETDSLLLQRCRDRFLFTTEKAYPAHPTNVFAQIWRAADKPAERNALIPSPMPLRE